MVRAVAPVTERRLAVRVPPEATAWRSQALLRPGQEVILINVSRRGALVASEARLLPGARAELQLSGTARRTVRGRITRSRVASLAPLLYEAAIVFDDEGLEGRGLTDMDNPHRLQHAEMSARARPVTTDERGSG